MDEYRIYEDLGNRLKKRNYLQAFLCFEQAEYLCADEDVQEKIRKKKEKLVHQYSIRMNKTSIIIISYNALYFMQKCLESIRKYCNPDTYEIIVVENASTDGVREWLQKQPDIKLILCDENAGFPLGCNIGMQYAEQGNDIFFLNNDTRMTPGALFWLRMGLYENEVVGAAGCVANYCGNDQQIDIEFTLPQEYVNYGGKMNIPMSNAYEEKSRLCGFAMLIRRSVLEQIGGMDTAFSPGYFEDDDLCVRIVKAGYRMIVCHNSFIYHAGSQSFSTKENLEEIITRNLYYFLAKWNYDSVTYAQPNLEAVSKINENAEPMMRVLEVGAGSGNTLSKIKYLYPSAKVYGIEENVIAVQYGVKSVPIIIGHWKTVELPFEFHFFDYIIFTRCEIEELEELKKRYKPYLKADGKFI